MNELDILRRYVSYLQNIQCYQTFKSLQSSTEWDCEYFSVKNSVKRFRKTGIRLQKIGGTDQIWSGVRQ